MSNVTRILSQIESGDPHAIDQLLPLVYDELRKLAKANLAQENPGLTLNATALVHEAYLRLVGGQQFANRRHFFGAAAEAMRRILIERARQRNALKYGGGRQREPLFDIMDRVDSPDDLIAIDEVLTRFAIEDPQKAELVKLRFFAGLTMPEVANALDISLATAERWWTFAKAWLFAELSDGR